MGLFPHHVPGSDRNILSPCPAHITLSWKALNPTPYSHSASSLLSLLLPPACLQLVTQAPLHRRTHTREGTYSHTHPTRTHVHRNTRRSYIDPRKLRRKQREANMLTNPQQADASVCGLSHTCVCKHAEAHANAGICDRTRAQTHAHAGRAHVRETLLFPHAPGCMGSRSRHTQTHSHLKGPYLPTES